MNVDKLLSPEFFFLSTGIKTNACITLDTQLVHNVWPQIVVVIFLNALIYVFNLPKNIFIFIIYNIPGREKERHSPCHFKGFEVYIHCGCGEELKFLRSHCAKCMPLRNLFRKSF